MPRAKLLVIRGGAIGDFILTLPAVGLLRRTFPEAQVELLGYKQIVALAEKRFYADATRSIEYAGLAGFFVPGGRLSSELVDYFAGFQQVVSYLFDPDGIFADNLGRAGVKNLLPAYSRIDENGERPVHAARQLARPLESLALYLGEDPAEAQAKVYPSEEDRSFAAGFLKGESRAVVAVHPGSGGAHKLWPLGHWQTLLETLRAQPNPPGILLAGGEADEAQVSALGKPGDLVARNFSLPQLAAVFERCSAYVGHDSGISHLAAAVGTPSVLLFGPTLAAVWAPTGPHVKVLQAPPGWAGSPGDLSRLLPETVLAALPSKR